ncbi:MAG TPA: hypothetical protein VFX92_00180 [Candidatus Krumholzibacteria bacterium]|nr:hypothetical protein [Candidatus Krumholzibacteria bacterium]
MIHRLSLSVAIASTGLLLLLACGDDNPAAPVPGPTLSFQTFQAASVVIGQNNMTSGLENKGGAASASSLFGAWGAPAPGSLYVPDPLNNRILGFNSIPTSNGASADFVLLQPNFTTTSLGLSATKGRRIFDVCTAGGKLFAVDNENSRVLIWNSLPTTTNVPADVVVGQPNFTTNTVATAQANMNGPARAIAAGGKLFVSDRGNNRVLIWNTIPTVNGQPADVVVGQSDFVSTSVSLSATSFGSAAGLWSDGKRLVVGESQHQRVLIWNSIPTTNGAPADVVVGAPNMTTAGGAPASATSIGDPVAVTSDGKSLFVSDGAYSRVLIYTPFPTSNGAAATTVLGQSNFTLNTGNDPNQDGVTDGFSAKTFAGGGNSPNGLRVIGNQLFVGDFSNSRVLIFDGTLK